MASCYLKYKIYKGCHKNNWMIRYLKQKVFQAGPKLLNIFLSLSVLYLVVSKLKPDKLFHLEKTIASKLIDLNKK